MKTTEFLKGEYLIQIIDFIKNFSDKYLHGKKDLLFKAMLNKRFPDEGSITVILIEYKTGRELEKKSSVIVYTKNITKLLMN